MDQNANQLVAPEALQQEELITPEAQEALEPATMPEEIAPPSTPENQQQTAIQNELINPYERKLLVERYGEEEAQNIMLDRIKIKQLEAKSQEDRKKEIAKEDLKIKQQNLNMQRQKILDRIATAESINMDTSSLQNQLNLVDKELQRVDTSVNIIEPNNIGTEDPLQDPAQNQQRIQAEDAVDLNDQIQLKKNSILEQMAQNEAEMATIETNRSKIIKEQNKIFDDIADLKKQAKETQVDPIWGDGSTATKIMAGLAIGLGAYSAALTGSNVNQGLDIVNNIIDSAIEQKNLSFKNQLALKSALLDKTKQQLQVLDSQTASKAKKSQLMNFRGQLEMEQKKIDQQLLMQQRQKALEKLSMNKDISPEQREVIRQQYLNTLDPKERERVINLGDQGGIQVISGTPAEAKEIREEVADAKQIKMDLEELKRLVDEVNIGEQLLSTVGIQTQDVRATEQLTNSIVGKLRLEILGPGVMTPAERDLVKSIVGNPNKLITTDEIEKEMLNRLSAKVTQGTRDRLRTSGVILPPSKNEIALKKLEREAKKSSTPFNRAKAINFLIEKGKWQEDSF